MLDAATGSADQPIAFAKVARTMGIPVRIIAIDINAKMLKMAKEETSGYPEIHLVQSDILALPFKDEGFDLAINNLSLHHFSWRKAVFIIKAIYNSARLGFLINDLHRSRIAHAAIFL